MMALLTRRDKKTSLRFRRLALKAGLLQTPADQRESSLVAKTGLPADASHGRRQGLTKTGGMQTYGGLFQIPGPNCGSSSGA
jgi:hypothetical protein